MLNSIQSLIIIDMDGVLWRENAPIGHLLSIFQRIRERGLKFVFATNNGSHTPEQYLERLAEFGVTVEPAPRPGRPYPAGHTGQPLEIIERDTDHDFYLTTQARWNVKFHPVFCVIRVKRVR